MTGGGELAEPAHLQRAKTVVVVSSLLRAAERALAEGSRPPVAESEEGGGPHDPRY
jgi:hypothetical protein